MSYSYRKGVPGAVALALVGIGGVAQAAQTYFQPRAQAGAEVDSNRALIHSNDTANKKETTEGYSARVGGTWGIATPRSETTIRPDLGYTDYPKNHANDFRAIVDLASNFRSQRSTLSITGRFDRRATFSSELASAQFNPVTPGVPTTPETGRISTDAVRTLGTLSPSYEYAITQRVNWGVNGTYQIVDYSGTNATRYVPYDYYRGGTSLSWALNPRAYTSLEIYGSRESAKDSSGSVNGRGITLAFNFNWSKEFSSRFELSGERDTSEIVKPAPLRATSDGVGATYVTAWKGQVSKLRLSAGRTFTPSGAGGSFRADQLQVQYGRDLSPRLSLDAAARFIRYVSLSGVSKGSNYDYVTSIAGLKWKATPTWFVTGGLEFMREKFEPPAGSANNGMVYVAVGYEGLGRQY
jgi:hypothetical protein